MRGLKLLAARGHSLGLQGFSLVELLIGIGISSVIASLAALVIQTSTSNFYNFLNRMQVEEQVNNAAHTLHNYFSMALNLQVGTPPLATFSNNAGQIVESYNLSGWTPTTGNGNVDVIAFFLRENLISGWNYSNPIPDGANRFPTTVIYFQKPTVDKFGVLYIKSDSTGASSLTASKADLRLNNIVDFEVIDVFFVPFENYGSYAEDNDLDNGTTKKKMVSSVTFKVTVRNYFGTGSGDLKWCPARFIASHSACDSKVPFKDTEKAFVVKIRNNTLSRGFLQRTNVADGATGIEPALYERSADTVYFLKPNIPIGQVKR